MPRHIQPQIRPAFVEQAVRSNWALIKVISVFAVGVELFNIIRVIFYSPSENHDPQQLDLFCLLRQPVFGGGRLCAPTPWAAGT